MLYSYPVSGAVMVIVPVATEHVGWVMLNVAAAGGVGWIFKVAVTAADMQVLSDVLLTRML